MHTNYFYFFKPINFFIYSKHNKILKIKICINKQQPLLHVTLQLLQHKQFFCKFFIEVS